MNLSNKIVMHELVEKFSNHNNVVELFESLCRELVDKLQTLSKEEQEKIFRSCEKLLQRSK